MSYQGMPMSGNGYGDGYGVPGQYPLQTGQGTYISNDVPRGQDGYSPAMSVQQLQPMQSHNGTPYHQQSQYSPYSGLSPQPTFYHPSPPMQSPQYYPTQYVEQQQQRMSPYQGAFAPQYDGVSDQLYHSPRPIQQPLPPHHPPQQHPSHFTLQNSHHPVSRPSPQSVHRPSPQSIHRPSPQAIHKPSPQSVSQASPQPVAKPSPLSISRPLPPTTSQHEPQPAPPSRKPSSVQKPEKISKTQTHHASPQVSNQVDQQSLLLALAEDYFTAAHSLGPSVASTMTSGGIDTYQKLIATGLGCLESALKNTRFQPRLEARVRIRYASVLLEETNNFMEAETALTKGLALCNQNRYVDLKYNTQFLLARIMFNNSPKAAFKVLDSNISDANAYQHYSWVYVFRFLRASLSFGSQNITDNHAALQNLRNISKLASERGDKGVLLASSLMEAIACLHSTTSDTQEDLQKALAGAWTYQSDLDDKIPQFMALRHIVDVAASIVYASPPQTLQKLKAMQVMMDNAYKDTPEWNQLSDVITIPISKQKGHVQVASKDTCGILDVNSSGQDVLMVSFLSKKELYILSYLVSGVALIYKNCNDSKAVKCLQRGLGLIPDFRVIENAPTSLLQAQSRSQWLGVMCCYFHIYLSFCAAAITDWKVTKQHLEALEQTIEDLEGFATSSLTRFLIYLTGMTYQGTGQLDEALEMFTDPRLSLPEETKGSMSPEEQVHRDLAILASLNSLWILQAGDQPDLHRNTSLFSTLEPMCTNHSNKDINTAFNLVRATVETNPPTPNIKTKSYLRNVLEGAKTAANTQFLCITLNIMCSKYFVGVVGDQAEKSAKAASVQARKAGNKLWISVADGMLAETLETQGKLIEAHEVQTEAKKLAADALQ